MKPRRPKTALGFSGVALAVCFGARPCAAAEAPASDSASSAAVGPRPLTFELAALTALQASLYDLPLTAHGGRATFGARVHASQYFSYAPQLLLEVYGGSTPHDLSFSSVNLAILMDVTIGFPWLHWEAFIGRGLNTLERATGSSMSAQDYALGLSVGPEYRLSEDAHIFALLGERWFGAARTTVVGLGFRM